LSKPALILVTPGFPKDEQDTTCLPAFQQFALSVKEQYPNIQLVIIAFQYPFIARKYEWHGIEVISIGGKNRPKLFRLLTWMKAYRTLQRIKRNRPVLGLLSLWITECALVSKYFAKKNNLKHYMWLIGQDAKTSNQYVKRIKAKGTEIIAMSDFLKEEFYKNHKEMPFMVAENGVNPSAFPDLNTEHRSIDVLGVGSFIKLKNYRLFIEIIGDLKQQFPHIKALLAGAGEEEQDLKTYVTELNLQDTIEFAGLLDHRAVFEVMNRSKVFLHTSDYEGNSTVLMEALYSGCYTFSTCPLSNSGTNHLQICKTRADFVTQMAGKLKQQNWAWQRVTFNTMDRSAAKIVDLFLR